MGPKTFQRRSSFSVANAQKYRFCATFILSDNHVVYMDDQQIISCINIQIIWYCERKLPVRIVNKIRICYFPFARFGWVCPNPLKRTEEEFSPVFPRNSFPFALGPDAPSAIRQGDASFRFSLTDNFDPAIGFSNI